MTYVPLYDELENVFFNEKLLRLPINNWTLVRLKKLDKYAKNDWKLLGNGIIGRLINQWYLKFKKSMSTRPKKSLFFSNTSPLV